MSAAIANLPIVIRNGLASDLRYIQSSWLRNYRKSVKTRGIDSVVYFDQRRGHHAAITRLLQRASVLIACGSEAEQQIIGWLCYEAPSTVHYVHVKRELQRYGVAHRLFDAAGLAGQPEITVSHWNDVCDKALKLGAKLVYNPYLLME